LLHSHGRRAPQLGVAKVVYVTVALALVAAAALGLQLLMGEERVQVQDAFFRRTQMGGGLFFVARNIGLREACIVGVDTLQPPGLRAELHQTVMEGGVAKMVRIERICIPPLGEARVLGVEDSGYHVMILQEIPVEAHVLRVRLILAGGGSVEFEAAEQVPGAQREAGHAHQG